MQGTSLTSPKAITCPLILSPSNDCSSQPEYDRGGMILLNMSTSSPLCIIEKKKAISSMTGLQSPAFSIRPGKEIHVARADVDCGQLLFRMALFSSLLVKLLARQSRRYLHRQLVPAAKARCFYPLIIRKVCATPYYVDNVMKNDSDVSTTRRAGVIPKEYPE